MSYPPLFITGTDGSGKSTLANWLKKHLEDNGIPVKTVWSRYNNLFSKPLLAATRLTGHNYYERHDGHLFGYHDFQKLSFFKKVYTLLQCIDVNIATYRKILIHNRRNHFLICERGPWDTMVDIMLDTGNINLHKTFTGQLFIKPVMKSFSVVYIFRNPKNIIRTRPELAYDRSLVDKVNIYQTLARAFNWMVIDNNGSLDTTKKHLIQSINIREAEIEAG